jgi:deoxyhypusine synthase
MQPIKHIKIKKGIKVGEIVESMGGIGFGAKKINEAANILADMYLDRECTIFFGVAGAMVPGGMREIILDMLDRVNVFVTTGANLTHDLIESLGHNHYHGDEKINDAELNKKGIDRIYNVFMKNEVYPALEDFFEKNWQHFQKCKNIKDLLWKIGELTGEGILHKCYEKKIPIFCPAIADSGIGLMVWGRLVQGKKINIDAFDDMKEIIDIAWTAKKRGVIYIGGGTPKNFVQQSLQFSKGADFGIQITTDNPVGGGSSGAPLKEGISWGKMNKKASFVDVNCDATIALPLIYSAVKEKI